MTVASYTTDISTAVDEANTAWVEPTASGWTNVSSMNAGSDTDNYIQGTTSTSCAQATKTGVGGAMTPAVGAVTIDADGAALIWTFCSCIGVLENESAGGYRIIIGNDTANFYGWNVWGKDTMPYSGWQCIAVNPASSVTRDYTAGSPSGSWTRFGAAWNITVTPSRGFPFAVDCVRAGRCEARFAGGTSPDTACTFEGFRSLNDASTARWGLIQGIAGGLLWQGKIVLGYGAACRFTDANVNISVANTKKVTEPFNTIEIRNASSVISWTNVNITALGTVSRGKWVTTDNATVGLTSCVFTDMSTFGFQSGTTCTSCTFRRCNTITPVGGKLLSCVIDSSRADTDTSAVVWNNTNPSGYLDGCSFTKGASNTNHAIEFPTDCPDAISLPNCTFTGYNASDDQQDSALHVKRTTGTVTITCAALPSVKSAGAIIVKVGTAVTVTVWAKDVDGNNVNGARVLLKKSDASGSFPNAYNASVTITNSGLTATVTHTAHGMATGDKVMIHGASLWQNNGVFSITRTGDNSYTYTLPESMGSNPTGSITATYVALFGTTSAGFLSTSREYPSATNVNGWIRLSSDPGPYYKTAPLTGTIPSSGSYTGVGVMILDS